MKKILVIEDEPDMRRNLLLLLRLENFIPLGAENGLKGIEVARAELPDLILCDVMMPELDGYGVIAALRLDPATASIPFIFLTARGEKSAMRAGMNKGADDYLVKPVYSEELMAAIRARLDRHEGLHKNLPTGGHPSFLPDFTTFVPLEGLGLTPRQAEILLWVAQGKTNPEIATILGRRPRTVKKHLEHIFERMGVETRHAAALQALETLSAARDPAPQTAPQRA